MNRWLPFPGLSILLLGFWLLLNQTLVLAHVLLGAVLAVLGPLALAALQAPGERPGRPGTALRLFARVVSDLVRSNFAVARIVLFPGHGPVNSGFVDIPLDLRSPEGLAVLACIITATPGTAWVAYDAGDRMLTIHVLDLIDEEAWVRIIKDRYEGLLIEVFE